MKKIKVGTVGLSYAHSKNFFNHLPKNIEYKKDIDWISPYRFLLRSTAFKRVFGNTVLRNVHFHPFQRSIDLFHFFNTVSFSNTPWITTFETFLPRWGMTELGIRRLASNSCKALVAMSSCAKEIQLIRLKEEFPEYLDSIKSKITVIHPSQNPILNNWKEKNLGLEGNLIFTIVGNDFFRKGGREVLDVFCDLIESGANLELRIISNLKFGDYASQSTQNDKEWAQKRIAQFPKKIIHIQNIPHADVIRMMRQTHIGLLPTYADTYGYSVLEFQATACPVISTNVRALPEINNKEKGWIIELPKDKYGEGKFKTFEDRKILSDQIKRGLRTAVQEIISNPILIQEKGNKALNSLSVLNCPEKNGEQYLSLYKKALGRN